VGKAAWLTHQPCQYSAASEQHDQQRRQSQLVCYSEPPLELHDDSESARRHVELPVVNGAAYFPPTVTSAGRFSTIGQHGSHIEIRREHYNDTVTAQDSTPAAAALVDTRRINCHIDQLRDDRVYGNGFDSRDVTVLTHLRTPTDLRQTSQVRGPDMEQHLVDNDIDVVTHSGLLPLAVVRQAAVQRQSETAGQHDTFHSCPDIAGKRRSTDIRHWNTVADGALVTTTSRHGGQTYYGQRLNRCDATVSNI